MTKRKTDAQFKKEVYDLVGNEYTFLDTYINNSTKIRVKHNKCNNVYKIRPNSFLNRGSRCPYCANKAKSKDDTQFKQEVFDLVGDEYTFLDPYVNAQTKLRVKHNKCGNIYKIKPNNFLTGRRCPYCSSSAKRTDAQFKKEIYDLVGDEYKFLDTYVNKRTKLRVKHNNCGNIYKVLPNNFLRGNRCPYCANKAKSKNNDQFKQEVRSLVGDEYTFLDDYVNNKTKLRVKHNKCGNVYKVKPGNFFIGRRCPYCTTNALKSNAQFKQEVKNLVGDDYTFLEPYQGALVKIKVKHNKCGTIYKVKPSHFLDGSRCPYCAINTKAKTNTEFKQQVQDLVGNEYVFLDTYVDTHTKLRVKHNECGNVYEVTPGNFLYGYRCPYCNSPKGEVAINKILKSLGINYEYQKTFDDLKDKGCLSYDFYIPDQNILIEYQGQQHYEPVDYFGGDGKFKLQQKHDKIKADYAEKNDYNLIAVPYTEDTFSKIKKYLLQHGLKN